MSLLIVGIRITQWPSASRQRLALTGWCEICGGEYAIVFTQHKGATYMETIQINEGPIYRTGRTDWR
ncbi:hypothetical protein ABT061_32175 [Streptosporangium sp. NPDC002544]|uniref:hypothetical protein n=1 Tax=Streptosporangium sp. NPDC002544 TaxID=3154538 RepID=UPI0033340CA4